MLVILPVGTSRSLNDEAIDLTALGQPAITRASHVEPDRHGGWLACLFPVDGPLLSLFPRRSVALATEGPSSKHTGTLLFQAGSAAPLHQHQYEYSGQFSFAPGWPTSFLVPSNQRTVPMSQVELDRQVSRLTGESLSQVRRRGFSFLTPQPSPLDPEADDQSQPQVIDWDQVDAERYARAA